MRHYMVLLLYPSDRAYRSYSSINHWCIPLYRQCYLLTDSLKYDLPDDDDDVCVWYYSMPSRIVYGVSSLFKYLELYFVYIDDEIILSHGTTPQAFDIISLCYRFYVDVSYAFPQYILIDWQADFIVGSWLFMVFWTVFHFCSVLINLYGKKKKIRNWSYDYSRYIRV